MPNRLRFFSSPAPLVGLILALGVALDAPPAAAQFTGLTVAGSLGRVIPVSSFEEGRNLRGRPIRTERDLRLEAGWLFGGGSARPREVVVGISRPDFAGAEELGTPWAIYGGVRVPVAVGERTLLRFDAAFGGAFGWREFDPVDNPLQISIGSSVSATFRLEFTGVRRIGDQLDLGLSAGYQHFSNGNLRQPNIGLNALPLTLGVTWRPEDDAWWRALAARAVAPDPADREGAGIEPPPELELRVTPWVAGRGVAADVRHTDADAAYARQLFPVAGLSLHAVGRISGVWRLAGVVGAAWDASGLRGHEVPELDEGPLAHDPAGTLSLGLSVLLDTGPAELEAGVGRALVDIGAERRISPWHQRLGLHLRVSDTLRPSIVLRALGFDRPHYIEWGIGILLR